jgi:hypothetical protein
VPAYLRTSTAANGGADKDSEKRHRAAVAAFKSVAFAAASATISSAA